MTLIVVWPSKYNLDLVERTTSKDVCKEPRRPETIFSFAEPIYSPMEQGGPLLSGDAHGAQTWISDAVISYIIKTLGVRPQTAF